MPDNSNINKTLIFFRTTKLQKLDDIKIIDLSEDTDDSKEDLKQIDSSHDTDSISKLEENRKGYIFRTFICDVYRHFKSTE